MSESDQDRVYEVIHEKLGLLEGPWFTRPKWWQRALRKRDDYIQAVLRDAGLPPLTEEGRHRYYTAEPQGWEDACGAWSRKWCAALGLSYREAFSYDIHPRIDGVNPA